MVKEIDKDLMKRMRKIYEETKMIKTKEGLMYSELGKKLGRSM